MADATCAVEGCPRPVFIVRRSLCRRHYRSWWTHGDPTAVSKRAAPGVPLAYFYATYLTPAAHDPGWPYATDRGGYGLVMIDKRSTRTSVLACTLAHGPMPSPKMHAAHACPGNTKCFWAEHLSWKTPPENEADKLRDGTKAILITDEMIAKIRERYAAGGISQSALGRELGVSQSHISRIVRNLTRSTPWGGHPVFSPDGCED